MSAPSRSLVMLALVCLCMQNSVLVLSMRYTRSVLEERYLSSSVVVMMEALKFIFSTAMCTKDGSNFSDILEIVRTSLPMCIPGLLYVMQNSLQLLAIKYLDASAFSILSQLKILTTAVCSVLMLGTHLSLRKWRALGLLVIGAILVQFPDASTTTKANESRTSVTGLAAVLGMVCISGLAGIYLEKYLKNKAAPTASSNSSTTPSIPQATLWERNLQLSLYGMLFALASVWYSDRDVLAAQGFFTGYSMWTWLVIVSAAGGGLIVAVVVKYTNTIVKGFATSISIIVTSVVSLVLFPEVRLSLLFWLGTACVLISIFNYNEEDPVVKAKVQDTPQLNGKAGSNGYKRMMEEELMGARLLHDSGAEEEGLDGPQSSLLRSATSPSHR